MNIPDNKRVAEFRLKFIERKMDKEQEYDRTYCKKIEDTIWKGYARKLLRHEINNQYNRSWYLYHFAVFNPKKSKKIRIVFEAAADKK